MIQIIRSSGPIACACARVSRFSETAGAENHATMCPCETMPNFEAEGGEEEEGEEEAARGNRDDFWPAREVRLVSRVPARGSSSINRVEASLQRYQRFIFRVIARDNLELSRFQIINRRGKEEARDASLSLDRLGFSCLIDYLLR